jgi:hypothetical protein
MSAASLSAVTPGAPPTTREVDNLRAVLRAKSTTFERWWSSCMVRLQISRSHEYPFRVIAGVPRRLSVSAVQHG